MAETNHKKVLFVIPPDGFDAEEFRTTRASLRRKGIGGLVASTAKDKVVGGKDYYVPELALDEADMSSFDAVVFIGGPGADRLAQDAKALDLARRSFAEGKLVAAIGRGVLVLARAGILKNIEVTGDPAVKDEIQSCGAKFTGSQIEPRWLEENTTHIVTANDSGASLRFGTRIARDLGL